MDNETPEFFNEKDIFGLDKPKVIVEGDTISDDNSSKDLDVVYATLGTRITAYIIDAIILLIVSYIIEDSILGLDFTSSENSLSRKLLTLVIWTVYYGYMESSEMQATLGKKFCDIKVIDDLGNRLTFKKAAFRYLAQIISILPLGFGIWAIAKDDKKQAWHDMLLDCYVIVAKPIDKKIE